MCPCRWSQRNIAARSWCSSSSEAGKTGKGKPSTGSPSSSSGKGNLKPSSKGKSGKGIGPCFICDSPHHGYQNCPDRFSKGFSKGMSKGSGKGKPDKKGKGSGKSSKGKGKSYYHEVELHVMTVQWDDLAARGRAHTRVVLDTGATENAVGIDSLHDWWLSVSSMLQWSSSLQTWKWTSGSGSPSSRSSQYFPWTGFILCSGRHRSYDTTFARSTYFEIQSKALWFHMTMVRSYIALVLVTFMPHKSRHCSLGHITIDLAEKPMILDVSNVFQAIWFQGLDFKGMSGCSDVSDAAFYRDESKIERIYMMEAEAEPPMRSMQQLARRLKNLQGAIEERERGTEVGSSSMRRSPDQLLPVLPSTQARESSRQSACELGDMHPMRPSTSVLYQERQGWQLQANGPGATFDPSGLKGIGTDSGCIDGHIQHSDRKDDGDQGKDVADESEHSGGNQHDLPGVQDVSDEVAPLANQSSRCWLRTWLPQQGDIKWGPQRRWRIPRRMEKDMDMQWRQRRHPRRSIHRLPKWWQSIRAKRRTSRRRRKKQGCHLGSPERSSQSHESKRDQWWSWSGSLDGPHVTKSSKSKWKWNYDHCRQWTIVFITGWHQILSQPARAQRMGQYVPYLDKPICGMPVCQPKVRTTRLAAISQSSCQGMQLWLEPWFCLLWVGYLGSFKEYQTLWKLPVLQKLRQQVLLRTRDTSSSKKGTSILKQELTMHTPKVAWISLACVRLSPLVNLTQRSDVEWAAFEKRQGRDLRRADEVSEGTCTVLEKGGDFGWEWPTNAVKGWGSHAISRLVKKAKELNRPLYWCRFHGCAYGLEYQGVPVLKAWTVLTSNRKVWTALQHSCPGHQDHLQCRGPVVQASAYYPMKMVQAIAKAVISSWNEMETSHLDRMFKHICFKSMSQCPCDPPADEYEEWGTSHSCFPAEPPSGAKLTAIRQMMLRIHRASGRPSMASLKKMLQMRGAPKWAQQMAENLQGPDCIESKKPHPAPPSLLEETPALFQQVGTDVFEAEYADVKNDGGSSNLKAKFVLWRDRASGLTVVDLLKKFGDEETKHWEPHEFDEEFLQVSGIESISEVDHLWSGFLFHQPGVAGLLLSKWHWSVNITCRSSLRSWSGRGNYRGFESNN